MRPYHFQSQQQQPKLDKTVNDINPAIPGMTHLPDAPVVDAHAHAFTLDMPLAPGAWHAPPADAPIEAYLATLDAHGVTFGVLAGATLFGTYNDYAIEACRRHRRLRTTVILDPGTTKREMQCMAADGVVGVRFQWRNVREAPDLTSGAYRVFLRRIADLGWQVHLHDDSERLPSYLDALEAAGVDIVVEHFGRPNPDSRRHRLCGVPARAAVRGNGAHLGQTRVGIPARVHAQLAAKRRPHCCGMQDPNAAVGQRLALRRLRVDDRLPADAGALPFLVPDPTTRRRITCETPLESIFRPRMNAPGTARPALRTRGPRHRFLA